MTKYGGSIDVKFVLRSKGTLVCNSSSLTVHLRLSYRHLLLIHYSMQLAIPIQRTGNSYLHQNIPRKRLRASSCSSIFLHVCDLPGGVPSPQLLMTALSRFHTRGDCSYRSVSCKFKDNFVVLVLFHLPPWKLVRDYINFSWAIKMRWKRPWRAMVNENFLFKSVLLFMTYILCV